MKTTTNTTTTKTTKMAKNPTKATVTSSRVTYLPQGIGCQTIGVPRNYIVGTLCRDREALNAFVEPLFGQAGDSTVGVAKGLLFYTMMLEGEYAILRYLPANTRVGSGEISDIPVDFLPATLKDAWGKVIAREFASGKTATVQGVVKAWQNFIIASLPADDATYGAGFMENTSAVKTNIDRGLLLYTIYREGELAVHGGFCTPHAGMPKSITVGMSFLPKDLSDRWQATIAQLFAANPATTEHDVMLAWREFVLHTVGDHAQRYVEQYATFYQAPELQTIPTGVMSLPSQGVQATGTDMPRVRL